MTRSFCIGLIAALVFPTMTFAQASKLNRAIRSAENLEPAIPRREQDKLVAEKLAALQRKTGKKPNIVWIVVDDMGYGDPG